MLHSYSCGQAATVPAQYKCGLKGPRLRRGTKIFDGGFADTAEWPWMVRLWMFPQVLPGYWGNQ